MSFDPYLHFPGTCAEALAFYADLFGGRVELMRYADAPDMPPELAGSDRIMHGSVYVGDRALMASDYPPGMAGDAQAAVSIMHETPDLARAKVIFDRLANEGGAVIMPFEATFWSPGFGMVKDRFGTHWMISGPMPQG